jgi:hypothetical protein
MSKTAISVAAALLKDEIGGIEDLRTHEFADDEAAHDDDSTEKLYASFGADFDAATAALSKKYGKPSRTGSEDDDVIPLSGILRFAIWELKDRQLFAAVAHEDRGTPILLMLGTVDVA